MRDIERYVFGRALCRTRPSLHTLFVLDTPGAKAFPPLGSHQAADSESASWDSYPRAFFMARPRITEVSLSPAPVVAASGSNPDYPYRLNRSPPCGGSQRAYGLALGAGNVPDEWVFSCKDSRPRGQGGEKLLSPDNGHFLAVCQVSIKYFFAFFLIASIALNTLCLAMLCAFA